jgi:hypothetical protein
MNGKTLRKIGKFLYKKIGGHINIGNLTLYGDNAMHFGGHFWTKKYGYICFRLPIPVHIVDYFLYGDKIRWEPLYLYFSPVATPWAATFMLGRGFTKLEKLQTKLRRLKLKHNFKYDSENEDYNYLTMKQINNL